MKAVLQGLKIPSGWCITWNSFYRIDPSEPCALDQTELFRESLLQMEHERADRLLDLGWYPEGDLRDGSYRLVLYRGDFRGNLLFQYVGRDLIEVVAEVERISALVADGGL
jgi:hypothetical protein